MPDVDIGDDSEILALPGRQTLDIATVRSISRRSDAQGLARWVVHLAFLAAGAALVWACRNQPWLLVPAMALLGFPIVTMFAAMHECVHKTAFRSPWLNETVGWLAGLICAYNFTYYRRYHAWHHRYTQDPTRDPELSDPKPSTIGQYLVHVSGVPFWINKPRELVRLALGRMEKAPFVPASARQAVMWSARAQLAVYAIAASASFAAGSPAFFLYWLGPALLGQPLLRAILLVEHTGCSQNDDGLTNTRTTLASWPVRLLMWNMPFHAEHHLYPSIPFFALPEAHRSLKAGLRHIAPSYPAANREVVASMGATAS